MIQIFNEFGVLCGQIVQWKCEGLCVVLVLIMGNLYGGYYLLVVLVCQYVDRVVVSIFVNLIQFGLNEDFSCYLCMFEVDVVGLEQVGCDVVWLFSVEVMYLLGVDKIMCMYVLGVSEVLEGVSCLGYFDGVCMVVVCLFLQVQLDVVVFGCKDYQQLVVIKQMVVELLFLVQIVGVEIVCDEDGLVKSLCNQYLSVEQCLVVIIIYWILLGMCEGYVVGQVCDCIEVEVIVVLQVVGFQVDYVVLCILELVELMFDGGGWVVLIVVWFGIIWLIDNLEF